MRNLSNNKALNKLDKYVQLVILRFAQHLVAELAPFGESPATFVLQKLAWETHF